MNDKSQSRSLHKQLVLDLVEMIRDDPSILVAGVAVSILIAAVSFAPAFVLITQTDLMPTSSIPVLGAFGAMQLAWIHVVWSTFENLSGGGV